MKNLFAQRSHPVGPITGIGPHPATTPEAPTIFENLISITIGLMTGIAGIWFFFVLMSGAISWIGAGGDRGKIEEARKRITTGLIGMAAVVAAIFVVQIVGDLIGFSDILSPANVIQSLR